MIFHFNGNEYDTHKKPIFRRLLNDEGQRSG